MILQKNQQYLAYVPIITWIAWVAWWMWINTFHHESTRDNFTDSYSVVALTGGIVGLFVAKHWGGFKSKFGEAIGFFSVGLLLQFLGQLTYALFYRIGGVELAFPSIGDLPYLLSNVAYIIAVLNLMKVLLYNKSIFKPLWVTLTGLVLTGALLFLMYKGFLSLAAQDDRGGVYRFMNVAYPIVQAIYFLLGFIALLQSRLASGGKMFYAVCIMLTALIVQYAADFTFLYQSYHETWKAAGTNDLVFVMAYGLMATSILMIDRVRRQAIKS